MDGSMRLRWGYIDTTGRVVIDFRFDHAHQFTEGLGLVTVDGRVGFIDKTGATVIAPQFGTNSQPFFEGLAAVETASGKYGTVTSPRMVSIW